MIFTTNGRISLSTDERVKINNALYEESTKQMVRKKESILLAEQQLLRAIHTQEVNSETKGLWRWLEFQANDEQQAASTRNLAKSALVSVSAGFDLTNRAY